MKKINNIVAGIVLYNPDLIRLKENIDSVINQVQEIILIDNRSVNIDEIELQFSDYENISLIKNSENFGIAEALNKIIKYSNKNGYQWVLTLDQDSVVASDLISKYLNYTNFDNVGIITCNIIDRNFSVKRLENDTQEFSYVTRCITSGCLTNVPACIKVGGFDEKMFIDYVDFDLCRSLINSGYQILKVNSTHIIHELGNNTKVVNFLNRSFMSFNQNAIRNYYFFRNWIYFIRKHTKGLEALKEIKKLINQIFIIILFEKNNHSKMTAIFKGIFNGFQMNLK